jgi:hypothetical protein
LKWGGRIGGIRRRRAEKESNIREQGKGGIQRPKLEMNIKYDKELLRDDLIDDLISGGYVPVQLIVDCVNSGHYIKPPMPKGSACTWL